MFVEIILTGLRVLERRSIVRKLSRQDVQNVAKKLGIDFSVVRYTPEAFRRAIESELSQSTSQNDADSLANSP